MLRHDLADKGSSRNSYGSSRKPSASVAIGGAEARTFRLRPSAGVSGIARRAGCLSRKRAVVVWPSRMADAGVVGLSDVSEADGGGAGDGSGARPPTASWAAARQCDRGGEQGLRESRRRRLLGGERGTNESVEHLASDRVAAL